MRVSHQIVTGVLAAGIIAGCGGSSHPSATSSAAGTSSAAALPPGAPPSLSGRVLELGELAGFTQQGRLQTATNPAGWVVLESLPASQGAGRAARLQSFGFVAAVREQLFHAAYSTPAEALSIVEQFRSTAGASRELAAQVQQVKASGATATEIAVPGISGARGFAEAGRETSGVNIAFAKGSYYYLLGSGWPTGSAGAPTLQNVLSAAQHLYVRVGA